jgi:hypothetical protein
MARAVEFQSVAANQIGRDLDLIDDDQALNLYEQISFRRWHKKGALRRYALANYLAPLVTPTD